MFASTAEVVRVTALKQNFLCPHKYKAIVLSKVQLKYMKSEGWFIQIIIH